MKFPTTTPVIKILLLGFVVSCLLTNSSNNLRFVTGQEQDSDGFAEINTDGSAGNDVSVIDIIPVCDDSREDNDRTVPNTMFTIYPSDKLIVSSYPPNLVSVSFVEDDDFNTIMKFSWSDGAYAGYPEGGVKIGIPADDTQLRRVDVDGGMFVQIEDGFVYLTDLNISGSSTLWATFGQLNSASNTINVQVDGASEATVDSIGPLGLVRAVGASVVNIKAPSIKEIDMNDSSKLFLEGNIFGGSMDGGSTVEATGSVEGGFLELDGGSTIKLGETGCSSGSICENDSSSICKDFQDNINSATIDSYAYAQPYTKQGTNTCTFASGSELIFNSNGDGGISIQSDSSSSGGPRVGIATLSIFIATSFAGSIIYVIISLVL
ncbi:hypothetical protein FRACYDRAFT_235241 [Fragilariopsis cylindrus CCMP1102]|uniref:Auto-transporter adhesin head GIN domain-containing protein n=1 Tax=Fragilariopsis cylindrus CCMP1102 TaxID=635003 RepID=A0A1E7FU30_9STRA|nr:hypothetical protein FRACYDRAFT_235241 [Fragilariopsis cylindrus CCMP1102]|eukprot:OEU21615.1 hypothetical protein FRACYDRAFT_235241 [Fragilariopsis cylindrus CCMP1102]